MSSREIFRVKWSAIGKKDLRPRNPNKRGHGWVLPSNAGMIRVKWDGAKQAHTYADIFIDRVMEAPE